jgi:ABC-2 type transport system ATP-binding protein
VQSKRLPPDSAPTHEHALVADRLSKSYGSARALSELSLIVPQGGVFGLLGPNGAGKTTFLRILMQMVRADGGDLIVLGEESGPRTAKLIGGYIDAPRFHPFLTGAETLHSLALLSGVRCDPKELLGRVGLGHAADARASSYSLGMKQRLAIATALVAQPPLIVLDEPLNGLDPKGVLEMRDLIGELGAQPGVTVIISSHLLDEVERVCEHVAIIDRGTCVRQGEIREMLRGEGSLRIRVEPVELALSVLGPEARLVDDCVELHVTEAQTPEVIGALCKAGAQLFEVSRNQLRLEALFLHETSQ